MSMQAINNPMHWLGLTVNIAQAALRDFLPCKVKNSLDNGLEKGKKIMHTKSVQNEKKKVCQKWDSNPRLQM